MEMIALLLLYVLSQKPDFSESVKPLFGNLKNTEELLKFLNDLNKFSDFFSAFKQPPQNRKTEEAPKDGAKPSEPTSPQPSEKKSTGETPPSPTSGIASDYIEKCLDAYFKKR